MTSAVQITTDMELLGMPVADYDAVSTAVGGWIELVGLQGKFAGYSMYVNEEGKMNNLPFNDIATAIWENSYGATDVIVGNAVLVSSESDEEGNELPLTDEQSEYLLATIKEVFTTYARN